MLLIINTNALFDVVINRKKCVKDSYLIWKLWETKKAIGYVSTLTFANIMYLICQRKTKPCDI